MKVVKEVKNVTFKIVEDVSKKTGNPYKKIICNFNGQDIDVGFLNIYVENSLLKAKVL